MNDFIDDTYKRVEQIIRDNNLKIKSFEDVIGVSNNSIGTSIRRQASFKSNVLNKILISFPEINPTWLLTGKEEMLLKNKEENLLREATIEYEKSTLDIKKKLLEILSEDKEVKNILTHQVTEIIENLK